MDLSALRSVVMPDDLLLRRDFFNEAHPRVENVAVGYQPDIVDLAASPG